MMRRNRHHPRTTETQRRHLFLVRRRTRDLIEVANQEDGRTVSENAEGTSPQDLLVVRALHRAERALIESVRSAASVGLDVQTIRSQGIERAVSDTIVLSDLAQYVVGEVRSLIDGAAVPH